MPETRQRIRSQSCSQRLRQPFTPDFRPDDADSSTSERLGAKPGKDTWNLSIYLAFALAAVAVAGTAHAQCTSGLYYADMSNGQQANLLPSGVITNVELPPNANPDCPTTRMLKLEIELPEECSKAVIWLQYEGQPSGWTLHVGDSATNNGFGGDAGTTTNDAELQILEEDLSVYSNGAAPDRIALMHLALTDGALNVVVTDQSVSWGQPYSALESFNGERLFAIPDQDGDGRRIYLGVNRVFGAAGDDDRNGCGARRVMISLE